MRLLILPLALALCGLAAACAGDQPSTSTRNSQANGPAPERAGGPAANAGSSEIGVAPSHQSARGAAAQPASGSGEQAPGTNPELDARVEKAVAKAKASGSAADKKAAAEALLARGNEFYNAGQPRLYRFALGDFRQALRYQPGNEEAKEKIEMIESIYKSMGRPVPDNGLEQ